MNWATKPNLALKPRRQDHRAFRAFHAVNSDDLVNDLIQRVVSAIVIPRIQESIEAAGGAYVGEKLRELFGGDIGGQDQQAVQRRRQFSLRVLVPLLVLLLPLFAWWLGVSLIAALYMETAFAVFYMCYAFVFTWGYGLLPGAFAIPAGYGDILVGLLAPFAALMIWQKSAGWRKAAYGLVIIGFLDFISAFAMGVVLRENGPVYQAGDLHTGLLAEFPLTMIPSFLVPVFMILHIIAILKLRGR